MTTPKKSNLKLVEDEPKKVKHVVIVDPVSKPVSFVKEQSEKLGKAIKKAFK